jgi:hypothetical protein
MYQESVFGALKDIMLCGAWCADDKSDTHLFSSLLKGLKEKMLMDTAQSSILSSLLEAQCKF